MEAFFNHKAIHFQNSFKQNIEKYQNIVVDGKFLIIIACHLDSELKINAIKNNYMLLKNQNADFVIVYSKMQPFNSRLSLLTSDFENTKFLEIENDKYYDFGKWVYALQNTSYSEYNQIIFTNDSFVISNDISSFFNASFKQNVDLFAYTSSNEYIYHYQTFLFSIKPSAIPTFIHFVSKYKKKHNGDHLLTTMEIKLYYIFANNSCLLDLGHLDINNNKNVFFHNKQLYKILFDTNILPFVKLKMLIPTQKHIHNCFR